MTLSDLTSRFDAVLVGVPGSTELIEPVLIAAGGRTLCRLAPDAVDSLDGIAPRVVVVGDLRGAGTEAEAMLDRIERQRADAGCPVVAVIDRGQIDMAAALLGPSAHLLCEPDDRELIAALTIAGGLLMPLHDSVGEGEAARLQRLNEEVARIAETLARLTGRDAALPAANDFRTPFDTGPSAVTIEAAEIRRTIRARRLRDRQFGQGLFEDPAWDMLLDLFAAELEHGQVSVSSLCVAAAVAPTTALRWIGKLTDAGLFRRQPDPFDRRRAFIELSARASAGMRSYVAAARAAGLPIA